MSSITSWTRLEPSSRNPNIQKGLQARVHDPLWLLARQWQLGEFQAEDAGTPVSARLRGKTQHLNRFYAGVLPVQGGTIQGLPYSSSTPLEMMVEKETLSEISHPGRMVEASLHFFRLLKSKGVGQYRWAYVDQYPSADESDKYLDADSHRYLRMMSGRTLDGKSLYEDMKTHLPALPATPIIEEADQDAVTAAASDWLTWYETRYGDPTQDSDAWLPERMEHAFAVAASSQDHDEVYVANEYHGGHLDWYHFNRTPTLTIELDTTAEVTPEPYVRTVIPSPVSFRGMPDARWWTFEDANLNLGNLEAGKEDLGRMLLLQYALNYSDDWFLMPLELDIGASLTIESLVVTDTFGIRTLVKPFGEVDGATGAWQMFTYAIEAHNGGPRSNHLFLPPTLSSSLNGRPVEEVHLLRDEMANMAWAVEYKVENARGQASTRHETDLIRQTEIIPEANRFPADTELVYRLMNDVPAHWIPLVPVADAEQGIKLQRGRMLTYHQESAVELSTVGRLLTPDRPLKIENEEVERAGAHVTRAYQYTRWLKGTTHLWMGRQKKIGRGEGWSGLRFDLAEFPPEGTVASGPLVKLSSVSSNSGRQGQTLSLIIMGKGLIDTTAVTFGNDITTQKFTVIDDQQIEVEISIAPGAALGSRSFQVTTAHVVVESEDFDLSFEVMAPIVPRIFRIRPTSGFQGSNLTLTIEGIGLSGASRVEFSGTGLTTRDITVIDDEQLTATLVISDRASAGLQQFQVTVTTAGGSGLFRLNFDVMTGIIVPDRPDEL
jgi:hypothetical protein